MGRDGYVRVAYPGFLFPFGHRCFLVQDHRARGQAPRHAGRVPLAALVHHPPRSRRAATRPTTATTRSGRSPSARWSRPTSTRRRRTSTRSCPTRDGVPFPFTLTTRRPRRRDPELAGAARVRAGAARTGRRLRLQRRRRLAAVLPGAPDPGSRADAGGRAAGQGRATPRSRSRTCLRRRDRRAPTSLAARSSPRRGRSCRRCATSRRRHRPSTSCSPSRTSRTACPAARPTRTPVPRHAERGRADPRAQERRRRRRLHAAAPTGPAASSSPNLSVRGISRALGADRRERRRAVAVRRRHVRPGVVPGRRAAQAVRPVQPARPARGRRVSTRPRRSSRTPSTPSTKLLAEAQRLRGRRSTTRRRGSASEVADAAHEGAQAVAQQAKDELDARVGPLTDHLDALVTAVQGLPGDPDAVSAAAVALAGDLQPLLDAHRAARRPGRRALRAGRSRCRRCRRSPTSPRTPPELAQMLRGRCRRAGHRTAAVAAADQAVGPAAGGAEHLQAARPDSRSARSTSRSGRRRARRRRSTSSPRSSTSTSTSSATATPG